MVKIRVITKRPGGKPASVWISPTLENLQRYVGGYIETVTFDDGLVIICDEEGRLKGQAYNCTVRGVSFVGDIIVVGRGEEDFCDLPFSFEEMKKKMPELWG